MILVSSERKPDGEGNIASRLPRFDIDPLPDSVAGFIPLRRLPSTIVTLISLFLVLTPHRSNDYSQNDCKSNLKAILLNKVVVGKGHKLTHDLTSLTAPPHGFDSVRLQILCIMIKVHFFFVSGTCWKRRKSELWWTRCIHEWRYPTLILGHVWALGH